MQLEPHSPKYLCTIQIPCDWSENDPETPVYDNFIKTLTDGDGFKQLFLEQFIGVAISNVRGYRMKKVLFLVGKGNTLFAEFKGQNGDLNLLITVCYGSVPIQSQSLAVIVAIGYMIEWYSLIAKT